MPLFWTVSEAGQGWPAEHWRLFWVTEVQKGTPSYSCVIAGSCGFPETCNWKGKDKTSFISLGYQILFTDKVGWFIFLYFGCSLVFLLLAWLFFPPICFSVHPHAYQCIISTVIIFCTVMSKNRCVYCQENMSFHLKPYNRTDWKVHDYWTFWAGELVCISLFFKNHNLLVWTETGAFS